MFSDAGRGPIAEEVRPTVLVWEVEHPARPLLRLPLSVGVQQTLLLSADGRTVYTANGPSGDVSVIDAATGKVERRVVLDGSPWGIAVAAQN